MHGPSKPVTGTGLDHRSHRSGGSPASCWMPLQHAVRGRQSIIILWQANVKFLSWCRVGLGTVRASSRAESLRRMSMCASEKESRKLRGAISRPGNFPSRPNAGFRGSERISLVPRASSAVVQSVLPTLSCSMPEGSWLTDTETACMFSWKC